MDPNEFGIAAPRWWKRPDGLIVPSTLSDSIPTELPPDLPAELRPAPMPVAFHVPVDASEQMRAFVDEELLGESVSTLDRVRMMIRAVGFEPALEALSILAARTSAAGRSPEEQLRLAEFIYGDGPLLDKIQARLQENPGMHVCAEQHIYPMMRLLIEDSPPKAIGASPTPQETNLLPRAMLGMSSVVSAMMVETSADFGDEEQWLPYLLQLAFFYASPQPLVELARAEILLDIADAPEARGLESFCPVNDWYRDELGFSAEEQTRLMMTFAAVCNTFDPSETKTHVSPEGVNNLLFTAGLIEKRSEALALISATREQYVEMFEKLDEGPGSLIWELRPFKNKPFLRCDDGGLVLLSPRFVQSWLTEGFHYRALDVARKTGEGSRYTAFAGRLYERACLRLMEDAHAGMPGVEVYGDLPYSRGKSGKTCDVAVDYVTDLVLIEATNSRPRAATLVSGDRDAALEDLDRVLVSKCRQLNTCIDRIVAADAPFPPALSEVRNIWPVVVSAGVPMQTPPLWNHLADHLSGAFQQARVRPLTLLDPEDYEFLCGLVEDGTPLPQLLSRKTLGPYRHLDLRAWFNDDPQAPRAERRPRMLEEAFKKSTKRMVQGMDFSRAQAGAA